MSPDKSDRMTREIRFYPGHNCIDFACIHGSERCAPGSSGSHGVGSATCAFYVSGPEGAVQFTFMLLDLVPGRVSDYPGQTGSRGVMASDLGYHSPKPMYEGHLPIGQPCEFVPPGKDCYYDGSGLNAQPVLRLLAESGGEAVFDFLEGYYAATFLGCAYPEIPTYPHNRRNTEGNQ